MPELEIYQLQNLIATGIEIGMRKMAIELGVIRPYVSKSEAYRIYGKEPIERWISEGLLKIHKDGDKTAKIRINRMDIEILAKANNRTTYLPTDQR